MFADGPVSVGYNSSGFLESSRFFNQNLGPGQECLKKRDKKTHFLSGLESRRLKGALESYLLPYSHIMYVYDPGTFTCMETPGKFSFRTKGKRVSLKHYLWWRDWR